MSVGSMLGFTGIIVAELLTSGVPVVLAVVIALIGGVLIGLWNGFIIAKLKINPFVTTLSSLSIFRGLSLRHHLGPQHLGPSRRLPGHRPATAHGRAASDHLRGGAPHRGGDRAAQLPLLPAVLLHRRQRAGRAAVRASTWTG